MSDQLPCQYRVTPQQKWQHCTLVLQPIVAGLGAFFFCVWLTQKKIDVLSIGVAVVWEILLLATLHRQIRLHRCQFQFELSADKQKFRVKTAFADASIPWESIGSLTRDVFSQVGEQGDWLSIRSPTGVIIIQWNRWWVYKGAQTNPEYQRMEQVLISQLEPTGRWKSGDTARERFCMGVPQELWRQPFVARSMGFSNALTLLTLCVPLGYLAHLELVSVSALVGFVAWIRALSRLPKLQIVRFSPQAVEVKSLLSRTWQRLEWKSIKAVRGLNYPARIVFEGEQQSITVPALQCWEWERLYAMQLYLEMVREAYNIPWVSPPAKAPISAPVTE